MKGELISYTPKDIYFLETKTNSESTNLANLFASNGNREPIKYKPSTKLKHKFNPALDFFIQNQTQKTVSEEHKGLESSQDVNKCTSTGNGKGDNTRTRKKSLDLYEEAAAILGLTCTQTDNCRCIECQCHYFDFEEEIDFQSGNDYMVDHASSCSIQ